MLQPSNLQQQQKQKQQQQFKRAGSMVSCLHRHAHSQGQQLCVCCGLITAVEPTAAAAAAATAATVAGKQVSECNLR
jgi:hypothetical protein